MCECNEGWILLLSTVVKLTSVFPAFVLLLIMNKTIILRNRTEYPGIPPDVDTTKRKAAKIRRYSARLSRVIVLLFNKLSTKNIVQLKMLRLCSALKDILANCEYRRISVMYRRGKIMTFLPYMGI